jgi:hypothetical protein
MQVKVSAAGWFYIYRFAPTGVPSEYMGIRVTKKYSTYSYTAEKGPRLSLMPNGYETIKRKGI